MLHIKEMKFLHTSEGPDQKQLTYPLRLFSGDVAVVADDEADEAVAAQPSLLSK